MDDQYTQVLFCYRGQVLTCCSLPLLKHKILLPLPEQTENMLPSSTAKVSLKNKCKAIIKIYTNTCREMLNQRHPHAL